MTETNPTTEKATSENSGTAGIVVRDLEKEYDTKQGHELVFSDISFEIEPGSFVSLLGRSGSGKSTILKIISGIIEESSGTVEFKKNGEVLEKASIGHIFQEPRLLDWNTCVENIEFVHENNPNYSVELAKEYLDLVGLGDSYHKYATQLSGGQMQRVGVARAFSIDPDILVMDEPFSNLDEITAVELRNELIDIWQQFGKTVFFVTHDIDEAVLLSDRILMLGNGEIFADMDVTLPRPRDPDSDAFIEFRQKAVSKINEVTGE